MKSAILTIHGHFINLSRVVLRNISQNSNILILDKINRHTFSSKSSGPTNSMDVVLTVAREVVVDDERDLLDVDASGPDVCRNQDSGSALTELLHDGVSFLLRHFTVHGGDCEVGFSHFFRQPVDL